MFAGQREACRGMVESHIGPTTGVVTGAAFRAELSVVVIVCFMTSITSGCSPFINTTDVTGSAGHIEMPACQSKASFTVIEVHITPGIGHMAHSAIRPKLSIVIVILLVTGNAILGRSAITVCMATLAFHFRVFPGQLKVGKFMIESPIFPGAGVMTRGAILPEAAIMLVILLVA